MSDSQSAINVLRAQYSQSFEWLEGTMSGVTDEVAHKVVSDKAFSIAGQVAHVVSGLDFLILGTVAGKQPLMMGSFAGKSGMSEPPPQGGDSLAWGQSVKLDLPVFHEYAKGVFGEIDSYLASIQDSDLAPEVDSPFGKQTAGWWFNTMLLNNYSHTGEISLLKGLQGLKGYPM